MMNKKAKATKQAKLYVVQTYTSWTEPKYQTEICTLAELKELQKHVDEVTAIHELGKEVKLQMAIA